LTSSTFHQFPIKHEEEFSGSFPSNFPSNISINLPTPATACTSLSSQILFFQTHHCFHAELCFSFIEMEHLFFFFCLKRKEEEVKNARMIIDDVVFLRAM
jgi:hypothetical protein